MAKIQIVFEPNTSNSWAKIDGLPSRIKEGEIDWAVSGVGSGASKAAALSGLGYQPAVASAVNYAIEQEQERINQMYLKEPYIYSSFPRISQRQLYRAIIKLSGARWYHRLWWWCVDTFEKIDHT